MHQTEAKVLRFIEENALIDKEQKVIVGVSGGADSIALLSILSKNGFYCIAAHCNFHLRGEESDRDMDFVTNFCKKLDVELHTIHFDTKSYASKHRQSIEMAARELRYNWFSKLQKEHNAEILAIAHHSDDVIETFFINLLRGAGLHGLTGIRKKNGAIVRPLLCVSKEEILDYLSFAREDYVTDSTNSSIDFLRNRIRNIIIPEFTNASPSAKNSILKSIRHLGESENLQEENMDLFRRRCVQKKSSFTRIDLLPVWEQANNKILLFELLRPFSVSESVINNILKCTIDSSGQTFYSNDFKYNIVKHRQYLDIERVEFNIAKCYNIFDLSRNIEEPIAISVETLERSTLVITPHSNHCYIDMGKIILPLKIRNWCEGDYFIPFGFKKKKKLSDFFINQKMSRVEKQNTYILENGDGQIIWIIGIRPDDRFRICERTEKVLHLSI